MVWTTLKKSEKNMNIPYIKKFDENGKVTNPIDRYYNSRENYPANRAERRRKPTRFRGNNKGVSLSCFKSEAYKRVIQLIQIIERDKKGKPLSQTVENKHLRVKRIQHYTPVK